MPVYGNGQNIRDWLYVEDHCRAIQLFLKKANPGETYNIGGAAKKTNLWIVKKLCIILDELLPNSPHAPHANLISYVEDRRGHDRRYAIDFSKLQNKLEWSPIEDIESGLRKTVQWYLQHQDWCYKVTAHNNRERLGVAK